MNERWSSHRLGFVMLACCLLAAGSLMACADDGDSGNNGGSDASDTSGSGCSIGVEMEAGDLVGDWVGDLSIDVSGVAFPVPVDLIITASGDPCVVNARFIQETAFEDICGKIFDGGFAYDADSDTWQGSFTDVDTASATTPNRAEITVSFLSAANERLDMSAAFVESQDELCQIAPVEGELQKE